MNEKKPMPLLLIEDDVAECIKFKDCANNRTDITFVGMTSSSIEGLQYLKTQLPEGIILDLQLNKGKGSGLQFLEALNKANLKTRPIIIITTSNRSELVYNHVEENGVDWIFCKKQDDYSAELVINTMLTLRKSLYSRRVDNLPSDMQTLETPEEIKKRISQRIDTELSLVGINSRLKGRKYLHEAICLLINLEKGASEAVVNQVATSHKISYSAVARAMQTAINNAWESSSIEDLQTHYKARIDIRTGVPSPTEFIHYYSDKIHKSM